MGALFSPGVVPNLQIAGRTLTDLTTNLIQLYFQCGGTVNQFCTMRRFQDTAGYAVPTGKSLRIVAFQATASAAAVNVSFGYADADVGFATATSFTNSKAAAGTSIGSYVNAISPAANALYTGVQDILIPATKYPVAYGGGAAGTVFGLCWGYLE